MSVAPVRTTGSFNHIVLHADDLTDNRSASFKEDEGTWKGNDDGKVVNNQPQRVMDDRNGIGPQSGYIAKITNDARETEMEENMGQVNTMIGNLRNMAIDMGSELENQNRQIDRINRKVSVPTGVFLLLTGLLTSSALHRRRVLQLGMPSDDRPATRGLARFCLLDTLATARYYGLSTAGYGYAYICIYIYICVCVHVHPHSHVTRGRVEARGGMAQLVGTEGERGTRVYRERGSKTEGGIALRR